MWYAKRLFYQLSLIVSIFFCYVLNGQYTNENVSGSWLVISGQNKIHEKWSVPVIGILRHNAMFETYGFSFVRTGLSYRLNTASTFTGGMAYLDSRNRDELQEVETVSQFWLYGEYDLTSKFKKSSLSHRWRLENRWITNDQETDFNQRLRYRLQYVRPLHKNTYIKAFNESFFNLEEPIFNQNRFFVGVGQTLSPAIKVDIGYFKIHLNDSDFDLIRMGLTFTTDFIKKDVARHSQKELQAN